MNILSMRKVLLAILQVGLSFSLFSQNWQQVGVDTFNYGPYRLYTDTIANEIYASGVFTYYGSNPIPNRAKWDGNTWTPLGTEISGGWNAFLRWNNEIYSCPIVWNNKQYVAKWNGLGWDSIGRAVGPGGLNNMMQYGNDLLVTGTFTSIDGVPANGIALWNGTNWSAFGGNTIAWNGPIFTSVMFNGELYVGGLFNNNGFANVAKWNGFAWVAVGNAFTGGISDVAKLIVYNNELYAVGAFTAPYPSNYIAKWNGTSWEDVGGGVYGTNSIDGAIKDAVVFSGKLFVGGDFITAGGVPVGYYASWDGTNWCGYGGFNYPVSAFTVMNNELYASGGFYYPGTVIFVGKWVGGNFVDTCGNTTGVIENIEQNDFVVYPNPSYGIFQINSSFEILAYSVYDLFGKQILENVPKGENKNIVVDLSTYSKGLYFIRIQTDRGTISRKIIIEH